MPATARQTCSFGHPVFQHFGDVVFRKAEADDTPVMIIALGQTVGSVPLRSLQAELGLDSESADGQMFGMVSRALDFVPEVRPGDTLPKEVLGGEASWEPGVMHEQAALARLKLRLVAAMEQNGRDWRTVDGPTVLAAIDDPGMSRQLKAAYGWAATTLQQPAPSDVARMVVEAARELSFIEALRDRLMRRVTRMIARVHHLTGSLSSNLAAAELVSRVLRLGGIGAGKMRARFEEVDGCFARMPDSLAHLDLCRRSIRLHRDWLYCSLRAWEEILSAWEGASPEWSDGSLPLLSRTYRFLAQRFLPMQEWQTGGRARGLDEGKTRMVW